MFFMVFVDVIGGAYPNIGHAPWDGIHLADFVMPFFLFVVGVSIALSYKSYYDLGVAAFVELLAELESKYNRRFEEIVKNEAEANRHREESDSTNRNPKHPLPIEEGSDPQQHAENSENPASNPTAQKTLLPDGMKQATENESAENDESSAGGSSAVIPPSNFLDNILNTVTEDADVMRHNLSSGARDLKYKVGQRIVEGRDGVLVSGDGVGGGKQESTNSSNEESGNPKQNEEKVNFSTRAVTSQQDLLLSSHGLCSAAEMNSKNDNKDLQPNFLAEADCNFWKIQKRALEAEILTRISEVESDYKTKAWDMQKKTLRKALSRALKLFLLGVLIQGKWFGPSAMDLSTFRIMGILQRIAVVYGILAVFEILFYKFLNFEFLRQEVFQQFDQIERFQAAKRHAVERDAELERNAQRLYLQTQRNVGDAENFENVELDNQNQISNSIEIKSQGMLSERSDMKKPLLEGDENLQNFDNPQILESQEDAGPSVSFDDIEQTILPSNMVAASKNSEPSSASKSNLLSPVPEDESVFSHEIIVDGNDGENLANTSGENITAENITVNAVSDKTTSLPTEIVSQTTASPATAFTQNVENISSAGTNDDTTTTVSTDSARLLNHDYYAALRIKDEAKTSSCFWRAWRFTRTLFHSLSGQDLARPIYGHDKDAFSISKRKYISVLMVDRNSQQEKSTINPNNSESISSMQTSHCSELLAVFNVPALN